MWSFPDTKALYARARQPAIRLLIGSMMIVPGAAFVVRAQAAGWNDQANDVAAAEATAFKAEALVRDAIAEAWRKRALEREREKVLQAFAARFRIPFDLANEIHFAALEERIDPDIAFGLVRAESAFRPTAVSPVGALGLTQLMPATARWLEPGITRNQILEPSTNLRVGFRYLRQLIDEYEGDERLALTAYNRGPGTVRSLMRKGRDPDNGYADVVITGHSDRHFALMRAKFGRAKKRTNKRS